MTCMCIPQLYISTYRRSSDQWQMAVASGSLLAGRSRP